MHSAPYFHDVADGPPAETRWLTASDGVRLRGALWPDGDRGTVLMFTGRTEYVEKYSRVAAAFGEHGLAAATLDWRGQGLADRALPDALTGHVIDFDDYQRDVAALLDLVRGAGLPEPYHLLAHSMGGAIGLRALHRSLPVASAFFSAPMWGILMSPVARPAAWAMSWGARALGHGHRYTPGTSAASYVERTPFELNLLTTDQESFYWMQNQTETHPELALGGLSLAWLWAGLRETRTLRRLAPPPVPCLAALGSEEQIVDPDAIHALVRRWPGARLEVMEGARHEVLMERPDVRGRVLAAAAAHFTDASASNAA